MQRLLSDPVRSVIATAVAAVMALMSGWRPHWLQTGIGSVALWAITLLAIAAAAVTIVRASFVPRFARVVLGLLALYAALAAFAAAAQGTPHAEWVGGEPIVRALPRWLAAGFVGMFVVIPIAALVHALKSGVHRLRSGTSAWQEANRAVALVLCVAIVSCHVPSGSPAGPESIEASTSRSLTPVAGGPPAPSDLSSPDPVELLKRVEELSARIVRADWDVDARARALDQGVEAAFSLVRDSVGYEAYSGVMRGSSGTYTTRAGNAADRALLLARLLASKGIPTQFAIGTLRAEETRRLFARVFAQAPGTNIVRPRSAGVHSVAFHDRLLTRAQRDHDVIKAALGSQLLPVAKPTREEVLAEMNPHVWVQAKVDGKWMDLDPSFPDARPGMAFASPDRVAPEMPPEFHQRVSIRIVSEHVANGGLVSSTLAEVTHNAIELIDRQIFIVHTREGSGNPMAGLGAALGRALEGKRDSRWIPAIWINGEFTYGTKLDVGSPAFVAEWIEFELSWPGGRREVTRRPLVDRAHATWRAARELDASVLRPLDGNDEGAFDFQALHNVWFSAGRHNLADFDDAAQDLVERAFLESDDAGTESSGSDFGQQVWPFALQNFTWMVWTDHVAIPSVNDVPGVRLYADGPRIAVFTRVPTNGDAAVTISDLRRDDLRGIVEDSSKAHVLAQKKLLFGLLQGALEQEALAQYAMAAGGSAAEVDSTSGRLTAEGVTVFTPRTAPRDFPAGVHPESLTRISTALRDGHVVVAPVKALERDGAWWEIAGGSGDTRSIGLMGLHVGKHIPQVDYKGGVRHLPRPLNQGGAGGPNVHLTPEARKEAYDNFRRRKNAQRIQDNIANFERQQAQQQANQLASPAKRARGGKEYAVLLATIVTAAAKAVIEAILVYAVVYELYFSVGLFLQYLDAH